MSTRLCLLGWIREGVCDSGVSVVFLVLLLLLSFWCGDPSQPPHPHHKHEENTPLRQHLH